VRAVTLFAFTLYADEPLPEAELAEAIRRLPWQEQFDGSPSLETGVEIAGRLVPIEYEGMALDSLEIYRQAHVGPV
jgi:hypothetical protein